MPCRVSRICQCPAQARTESGPEGAALDGHLHVVVEPRRQLSHQPGTGRHLLQRIERAGFGALVDVAAPEHVRLGCPLGQDPAAADVSAGEAVAVAALVELAVENANDGRREQIDLRRLGLEGHSRGVERAARVDPVGVADEALVAERDLLTAESRPDLGVPTRLPFTSTNAWRRSNDAVNGVPVGPTVLFPTRASCSWTVAAIALLVAVALKRKRDR